MNRSDDTDAEHLQARWFRVRPASPSDLSAIRALLEASGLPTVDLADRHIPWYLLAEAREGIIGSAAVEPCGGFGLLLSLAVHATARGQGVARSLVEAVEAQARSEELRGLYLLTTSGAMFFARLGYTELERWELPESIRRTRAYRELCPQTARAMMKRLS